jgi:CO/xanthine dehydrogenase FAD-binding subunit
VSRTGRPSAVNESGGDRLTVCTVPAVPVLVPTSLDEAVAGLAADPEATLLAGGTDLLVEINEGHRRLPWRDSDPTVIALTRVPELSTWTYDPEARTLTIGAAITWAEIEREPLRDMVPALAEAARTVGSPQIRNAGTVGGNLATCSPAGDGLPVLAALDATVQLVGSSGRRAMPVAEFMVGVKRTALAPGEMIESVTLQLLDGWQGYSKVGVRNAMVIATASACLASDRRSRSVRLALGSVAPTIIRCPDAEAFAAGAADWDAGTIEPEATAEFGRLAAADSRPIDDHRSTAAYRRHAVAVMATRLLQRAFPGGPT